MCYTFEILSNCVTVTTHRLLTSAVRCCQVMRHPDGIALWSHHEKSVIIDQKIAFVMQRVAADGHRPGAADDIALADDQVQTHLRHTVVNQIAIDQPKYSGFKTAVES